MPNPFTRETLNSFERFQRNRANRQAREESARVLAERGQYVVAQINTNEWMYRPVSYSNVYSGGWNIGIDTVSTPQVNTFKSEYSIGDYVFMNPELKLGDRVNNFSITRDMMKCSGKICKISYVDSWDGSYRLDILMNNLKPTGTRIGWFTDKMLIPLKTNKKILDID